MEGVFKYLLQNYHILGILLIVTVIAIKLFMTTRQAKKLLDRVKEGPKLDDIAARLARIEKLLETSAEKPKK